jgi:anion-transporting  ArsA/GET3 family ATPase
MASPALADVLRRRLIFVGGKGGVGKTAVSQAIARSLPGKVLWVAFDDPTRPPGELVHVGGGLWHLNCEAGRAFAEYVGLKIGVKLLTQIFLRNQVIQYLATAAPGIHELVLLGKVWYERNHWDHVVCDMPSTGYGIAMFSSTGNFERLFGGGPLYRDAQAMDATFSDPKETGHVVVSLPEEMPLQEALELRAFLTGQFPGNAPAMLVNRIMPELAAPEGTPPIDEEARPYAADLGEFLWRRSALERANIERSWGTLELEFSRLPFVAPEPGRERESVVEKIAAKLTEGLRA